MIDDILLIGCGRMGGALLSGWRAAGTVGRAVIVDPAPGAIPEGIEILPDLASLPDPLPQTILLAVKPQMMDAVMAPLAPLLPAGALVVSIAAGKPLAYFAERLGEAVPVIRTMPNTPAAIGRGITVCCAGARADVGHRRTAEALMSAVGRVAWVEDERLMHAVTALSGSGPAYVFLLIEAMAAAGVAAGLPTALAGELALATVAGAGELARQSGEAPAKLRADVTSPAGTTAAALEILMEEGGLSALIERAVAAAAARSRVLAGEA